MKEGYRPGNRSPGSRCQNAGVLRPDFFDRLQAAYIPSIGSVSTVVSAATTFNPAWSLFLQTTLDICQGFFPSNVIVAGSL